MEQKLNYGVKNSNKKILFNKIQLQNKKFRFKKM